MSDAERFWRGSTWERVCDECFGGDPARMLDHARRYRTEDSFSDSEFHLGKPFRDIVGARNRTKWWARAIDLLEEVVAAGASEVTTLEIGAALAALQRGETVRLVIDSVVFATVTAGTDETAA